MKIIYRIQELIAKFSITLKESGWKQVWLKIRVFFLKNLLGKNFTTYLQRGSYALLWRKVFESYRTKGWSVFVFRFILVLLYGWVVIFITPKEMDFIPEQKVIKWYKKNKKKVSIVIPTYNDYQLTKACVESIWQFSDKNEVVIIIVDDGSDSNFVEKLATLPATLITKKENSGFSKTVNEGLRQAKGDVVLLNNDTLVTKGWLEALQYWAYSDKKIGIVGPKLVYHDNSIQWAGTFRNPEETDWFDHYFRSKLANYAPSAFSHPVLAATGACMYIKREVLTSVGSLDEKFGMAFEDVDFSLRAWEKGFKTVYCPKSVVFHLESKTRGKKQGERELKSKDYFWSKWGRWFNERNVVNDRGKLKIIYVSQDNGVGGGPRVIFEHLNRLAARGHEVVLYSVDQTPDWFDLKVPVRTFKNYEELKADLEKQESIKVATWWETEETVWQSSLQIGIGVFFVQDIESSYYKDDPDYEPKVLSHYRRELNYITVSSWDQEKLDELDLKSTIISPGISEIYVNKNLKRDDKQILAIGRNNPLKNFSLTEKAWKLLKNKYSLKLFGIEPRLGKELGVSYVYKPTDKMVVDLYNQTGVFVQTSFHEGFCLPILEAMASGCPVVTTDSDGNKDFYVDGENCLIVSKTDPKDVAEKLERVLTGQNLRQKLIKNGLLTAENYRWEKKIDELEAYYIELAQKYGNKVL